MKNEERLLRAYIRKGIEFNFVNKKKVALQESKLRNFIRKLILEVATEKVEADPHRYTGINVLRELFKNSNILKTLREKYKTMTTNPDQRKSFRAHIVSWCIGTLAPIEATERAELSEAIDVDIDVITDEDKERFIDADDGSDIKSDLAPEEEEEEEENEEDEDEFQEIEGEDTTGRNKAKEVYPIIQTSIVDYFSSLDDIKDQELFKKWLVANLKLYFDKWEKELQPTISEPESEEYNQAQAGQAPAPEAEQEAPPPEIPETTPPDLEI